MTVEQLMDALANCSGKRVIKIQVAGVDYDVTSVEDLSDADEPSDCILLMID